MTVSPIVQTLIAQLTRGQGAVPLRVLTNAQIVVDDTSATIVFPKQVGKGKAKLTHLKIAYNAGSDLYDITSYKLNRKTFEMPVISEFQGVYAEDLTATAERLTDLCLHF